MYPTGGYGNFLYYLLSEQLESTVKPPMEQWDVSSNGDSHQYPKYTEIFNLGSCVRNKNVKNFTYNYNIINPKVENQIKKGKKFLVLADVGNTGDNVKFLKRYFPNATVVRIFAKSFSEKLVLWANCMTKLSSNVIDVLYPGSIMPASGIAAWAKKSVNDVTDSDAINCMLNFFQTDFDVYGQFFNESASDAINIPLSSFFNKESIHTMLHMIAHNLNTQVINSTDHEKRIQQFLNNQTQLSLLDSNSSYFPLAQQALAQYANSNRV
jgi:hypothetical protein